MSKFSNTDNFNFYLCTDNLVSNPTASINSGTVMKAANRNQFFKTTLGFMTVSAPNDPKETWLIPTDSDIKSEMFLEWQIPARDAAYNAFMEKLAANEVPVFTSDDLDPKGEFQKGYVQYTQVLLDELAHNYLAQAIIDDEREIVKAMLDRKPELLLCRNFIIATSEHTGQRFALANFLGLACLRKQIEMVKIITPYFDKLLADLDAEEDIVEIVEIEGIKNAGLAQWLKYPTNANGEIQVPAAYQAIIDDLIKVFTSETMAVGNWDFRTMSPNIETAMEVLYNRLSPDYKEDDISKRRVLAKQNHLDIELLLYTAYKAYNTHFKSLKTWERRNAYCIRVIGILQNFLPPETAKIFCAGIYNVVNENRAVSTEAAGLKLKDGTSFYSGSDFANQKGLGFEFFCSAQAWERWGRGAVPVSCGLAGRAWETYVKQKQNLSENYTTPQTAPNPSTGPQT